MSSRRPSIGFSLVVATYALTVAFFAWGLSTPPLDRVWQLHHELKIGRVYRLSKDDRTLLRESMIRHPALAGALLGAGQFGIISAHRDGWIDTPVVSIIRTPRSPAALSLVFDIQTPPQYIPYEIEIKGYGWEREMDAEQRGPLRVELPAPPAIPELITIALEGDALRADPSSIAVRLSFDPPIDRAASAENDEEDE